MSGAERQAMAGLIAVWRGRARRQLAAGEAADGVLGARVMAHGARCYSNAAAELEALLAAPAAVPSPRLEAEAGRAFGHPDWQEG
jgi:hypothetical protein